MISAVGAIVAVVALLLVAVEKLQEPDLHRTMNGLDRHSLNVVAPPGDGDYDDVEEEEVVVTMMKAVMMTQYTL